MTPIHSIRFFISACLALLTLYALPTVAADMAGTTYQQRIDLGGAWDFALVEGKAVDPKAKPAPVARWDKINVPGNWYRQGKDIS